MTKKLMMSHNDRIKELEKDVEDLKMVVKQLVNSGGCACGGQSSCGPTYKPAESKL